MSEVITTVKCPTCNKVVSWVTANTFKPFCSEKCKQIDFSAWIFEEHTIPGDSPFQESSNEDRLPHDPDDIL